MKDLHLKKQFTVHQWVTYLTSHVSGVTTR